MGVIKSPTNYGFRFICIKVSTAKLVDEFKNFLDMRIEKSGLLTSVILEDNDVVFWRDSYLLQGRDSYFASKKGDRTLLKGSLLLNK